VDTLACREFKFSSDTGEVAGYGAVFGNVDQGLDRIQRGAFASSLRERKSLPMLFQHDAVQTIGVWASMREDDHGLAVSGRISDTIQGRDVRTLAKDGAVTGLSIGFIAQDFDISPDGVRVLKQIDLHEVSVVTFPMNQLARVQSVKAALRCGQTPSRDELTFLLRNAGLSRRATRRLLDHGFAGLSKQLQAVEALNWLAAKLEDY